MERILNLKFIRDEYRFLGNWLNDYLGIFQTLKYYFFVSKSRWDFLYTMENRFQKMPFTDTAVSMLFSLPLPVQYISPSVCQVHANISFTTLIIWSRSPSSLFQNTDIAHERSPVCLQHPEVYPLHINQDKCLQCINVYIMFLLKYPPVVSQYWNVFFFLNSDSSLEALQDYHPCVHLSHAPLYAMFTVFQPHWASFFPPKMYAKLGYNSWSLTLTVSKSRTSFS